MASLADILLGQDPATVRLTPEQEKLKRERDAARAAVSGIASGAVESPAIAALRSASAGQAEQVQRAGRSRIASARGPAAQLQALRQAGGQESRALADIAGQTSRAVGELSASEQGQARGQEFQMLQAETAQAQLDEEERKRKARAGILDILGTAAGSALGSKFGPGGAATGGQLGHALGTSFQR